MKKSLFYIAAASLALVSCNEEELVQVPANQVNGVLTATFEQDAATRTSIGANNALAWSEGDAIAVFGENAAVKYNLSDASAGTFTTEDGADAPKTITGAAFPYAEGVTLDGTTLTMTLPATIDQTAAGELDFPMWGTVAESNIEFKHLAGVLKVNLAGVPAGYNKLTVTADKPISGTFTATTTATDPVLASASAEKGKTVEVEFTAATAEANDYILYLPLPVGYYSSIMVSVTDGTNTKELKELTNKTVERAKVYSTSASGYTTIMTSQQLVENVANTSNVILGDNITLTDAITIPANATVTLDLNGKTISQEKAQTTTYAMITNKGTLTIKDSGTDGKGKITYKDTTQYTADVNYASNTIHNEGTLTLESGTIENTSDSIVMDHGYPHAIDVYPGSTTNINGGTVRSANYDCIRMFCNSTTLATTVNIDGGSIINRVTFQNPGSNTAGYGRLNITNGTFTSTENVTANIRLLNFSSDASNMKATISGGTFDKGVKTQNIGNSSVNLDGWLTVSNNATITVIQ